jgi:hypothetical protein
LRKHERPQPEARGVVNGPRQDHLTALYPSVTVQPEADCDELSEGVMPLVAVPQEWAVIPPGTKAEHDSTAAPADAAPAFRRHESIIRMPGVNFRLLERLLAFGKFVGCQEMQPETLIGGAYTAMSAAYAMEATRPTEIFVATMYLGVAMIYLIVPYQRKGDRPAH